MREPIVRYRRATLEVSEQDTPALAGHGVVVEAPAADDAGRAGRLVLACVEWKTRAVSAHFGGAS